MFRKTNISSPSRPILGSNGMRAILQKKGKKMAKNVKKGQKKGKIFENLGKNVQNLEIF